MHRNAMHALHRSKSDEGHASLVQMELRRARPAFALRKLPFVAPLYGMKEGFVFSPRGLSHR